MNRGLPSIPGPGPDRELIRPERMSTPLPPIHPDTATEVRVRPYDGGVRLTVTVRERRGNGLTGSRSASLSIEDIRELIGQLIGAVEDHYAPERRETK